MDSEAAYDRAYNEGMFDAAWGRSKNPFSNPSVSYDAWKEGWEEQRRLDMEDTLKRAAAITRAMAMPG